ncbi:MAG TPA: small ribosomal subunit Rsm22 family protein [Chloroflexaceae bacterium]|nr:small ribosomal subunit Rsm22 family protein [Chloroflexaceae bacterium]
MELPHLLRLALERELRGRAGPDLARGAADLSARYRRSGGGPVDPAAYAAARMPATYAATFAALGALAAALPGFAPRSLLDAGAGTGAALWAAQATWPGLETAELVEGSQAMLELGSRLAARGGGAVARARWARADLTSPAPWGGGPRDLVTAAYVLGELPEGARPALVDRLWSAAAGALLLVEPGTPRGWATIRAAREQLRAAGAQIVAPCPHQGACPMPADPEADWCHFARRLPRLRAHREAKGAERGFEDEKYAYLAVARRPGELALARILRHPLARPGRVELALCTRDGLRSQTVTRADRGAWPLARDLAWGDAAPPEVVGGA